MKVLPQSVYKEISLKFFRLGVEMKVLPQSVYKEISLKFFTTLLGIPLTCGKVFYSITYLNLNHYIVFFFFFFE